MRILILILLFLHTSVFANMAEPVFHGTLGSRPFINEFVDVVHENLSIKLDNKFDYALFNIKYHIYASKEGLQIPFLFYASEYLDSFSVKIDGVEVNIQDISYDFKVPQNTKFKDFAYFFENQTNNANSSVMINNSPNRGFHINLQNMLYFETDISVGEHLIEVNYRATKWIDSWDWVNEYSFRYALSPVKYWKSFGSIDITIDATAFDKILTTNLGTPSFGNIDSIAKWNFSYLPTEILQIKYNPIIEDNVQYLINIGPSGLAYITGGILAFIHIILLILYRKKYPLKKYSKVLIVGCIIIPLVFLASWINYYDFIDSRIGQHASKSHGYYFLVIILYPVITPVYFFACWLIDRRVRNKTTIHQDD